MTRRSGITDAIFLYNGRDGVVTDSNGLIYMRARYYSPELRRFINADILAGDIANAVTLNRYAYANANPVSFVDPLGLLAIKTIKNNSPSIFYHPELMSKIYNYPRHLFKFYENAALLLDSALPSSKKDFGNYESNSEHDVKDTLIDNQWDKKVKNLKIGDATMGECGCEVIAIYNAMILYGMEDVSLAETINTFENSGALTFPGIAKGSLGSNPYAIPKMLDEYGMQYEKIKSFDDMDDPGLYVVAFWNSDAYDSMIHTITVEVTNDGEIKSYNGTLDDEQLFITGYKIERK